MKKTAIAMTILLAAVACSKKEATNAAAAALPGTAAATAAAPGAAAPAANNLLTGKVLETFNGGGYTYVRLATASGEEWAAVRETKVNLGDTVSISAEMTMEKFKSNTLNRTFDRIAFGSMAGEGGGAPAQMPAGMASGMGSATQHMKVPGVEVKVEKAAGGKTVAEVWAGKGSLGGKEVVVRGKVVKFLGGIMGTNWMHLQDGSGSAGKGDNDLTVTTDAVVAKGDVVTVKGTLAVDKDFGSGYRYAVIIEKASVTK